MTNSPVRLADLRVLRRRPLMYRDAVAASALGLSPHVRGASSAVVVGDRVVVVEDDAAFVAITEPHSAVAEPLALPLDAGADLEACALLPSGELLMLGSGASARSEVAVLARLDPASAERLAPGPLFSSMRSALAEKGARVHVEGVTVLGDVAHVLHGSSHGSGNAIVRLSTGSLLSAARGEEIPPSALKARAVELGSIEGAPLTWTDAADVYGVGVVFTAVAESAGEVVASCLGVFDHRGRVALALLRDQRGDLVLARARGVAVTGKHAFIVASGKDAEEPSELLELSFGALSIA